MSEWAVLSIPVHHQQTRQVNAHQLPYSFNVNILSDPLAQWLNKKGKEEAGGLPGPTLQDEGF